MNELEWVLNVEEPKLLGEEDVFDMHLFCKIKYIYHILPSGEKTHFTVGGRKYIIGCDPVSTTNGTFNVRVSKNRPTSTSTTFKLW
jgi:hypothetical protein